jgi:hypothetical protein
MAMRKIRRFGSVMGGVLATLVLTTLPAAAAYPPPLPKETVAPKAAEEIGVAGGQVAFTGSDLILLIGAVALLLVAGAAALIGAKRRAISVSP